jgi:hypothetical protein
MCVGNERGSSSDEEPNPKCLEINDDPSVYTSVSTIDDETTVLSCLIETDAEYKIQEITRRIHELYQDIYDNKVIRQLILESYKAVDENYGIREAVIWGDNFVWPADVYARDWDRLVSCEYSLSRMTRMQHHSMSNDRLSPSRINKVINVNDPDHKRLMDLAFGMRVIVAKEFQENRKPPPMRNLYVKVCSAVNKLLYDLWLRQLVFILPTTLAISKIPNLHFSPAHWTTKSGKQCGRNIFDSSDTSFGTAFRGGKNGIKRLLWRYSTPCH